VALAYARAAFEGSLQGQGAAVPYLRRALEAVGEEDSPLRGMLLCALSLDLQIFRPQYQLNLEEREALALEAKALGERIGDPGVQANALWRLIWCRARPEHVRERLTAAKEMISLAERASDVPMVLWAHWQTVADSLFLGDMETVDREIDTMLELAEQTREPFYLGWPPVWRAMRACMEGKYAEAERLAQELLVVGQRLQNPWYLQSSLVQLFDIRANQGRIGELEGAVKGNVEQQPENLAWLAALAYLYALLEREAEAREYFEKLAVEDFANVPDDVNFLITIALAAYTARFLGDARRAEILYRILMPYKGLTITVNDGALCAGSASLSLGELSATMSRWDEAEAHYVEAITMNERIGARPWLARSRLRYAEMLLTRDRPGDRQNTLEQVDQALPILQEVGMEGFMAQAIALKLQAQGIDPSATQTSIDAVASAVYVDKPDLRPHAAPDGTVTILFSDIEGSTAMTERLGDQRWLELLRAHNAIVRQQVTAHEGFEVKSEGDGFMLAFQSARKALQCAAEIQRAFADRNESADEPIHVRIGLHTGEAIKEADDFYGKNVILAARIAGQAGGGEILVSSLLKELTESAGDIAFGEGREVELKGLAGQHRVFEVPWEQRQKGGNDGR
jgi:class 3 adenylate cyclase